MYLTNCSSFKFYTVMLEKFKSVGPKSIDADKNPEGYVGRRVAKTFFDDNQIYIGTIKKYADGLWYVEYDDGESRFEVALYLCVYCNICVLIFALVLIFAFIH